MSQETTPDILPMETPPTMEEMTALMRLEGLKEEIEMMIDALQAESAIILRLKGLQEEAEMMMHALKTDNRED